MIPTSKGTHATHMGICIEYPLYLLNKNYSPPLPTVPLPFWKNKVSFKVS